MRSSRGTGHPGIVYAYGSKSRTLVSALVGLGVEEKTYLLGSLPVSHSDIRLERLDTEIFTIRLLLIGIIEHSYDIIVFAPRLVRATIGGNKM